jgi:hypothetical protein
VKLPIAELIGNEGPVPPRKAVHNSLCAVGDNVFPRFLCCFAPRLQGVCQGCPQNESNRWANLLTCLLSRRRLGLPRLHSALFAPIYATAILTGMTAMTAMAFDLLK